MDKLDRVNIEIVRLEEKISMCQRQLYYKKVEKYKLENPIAPFKLGDIVGVEYVDKLIVGKIDLCDCRYVIKRKVAGQMSYHSLSSREIKNLKKVDM